MALDLSGKKILVIDDFPEMRSMLRKMGVAFRATSIDDARNGEDALKMLTKKRYDIVLCDYNLGDGKDGQNVLEEAKHKSLLKYSTVFMMITAENTMKMVMGAMENYPDGYLTKPFTKGEFAARLEKAQNKKANFKDIEQAIQRNDFQSAIDACDLKLIENPANKLEILKIKADIWEKMSKYDQAEILYNEVLEKRELPWAKMGLARTLYHLSDYESSKTLLLDIIDENPNFTEAYDWLAKIYLDLGDPEQAQRQLKRAIEISPKALLRHKTLGKIAYENQNMSLAEESFKKAVKLGKNSCFKDVTDYTNLSKVYLDTDSPTEALKLVSEIEQEFEDNNNAKFQTAIMESMIHKHTGDEELANQALDKANTLFDNTSDNVPIEAIMDLTKTCLSLGKDEMGQKLSKYIVRNHHDDAEILEKTQDLFNEFDMKAIGEDLINSTCKEVVDVNNRGVELTKEGKLNEAIDFLEKAAVGMPENKTINLNAAQALIMLMQKEGKDGNLIRKTGKYLERLNKIDPLDKKFQRLKSFYIKLTTER